MIGSWFAAFLAGAIPKIKPTVAATPNEMIMEVKLTIVGISANRLTAEAIKTPSKIPMDPPDILIKIASNMNCTDYRVQTMAGMLKAKRVRLVCDQPKLYELAGGDNFIASLIEQEVSRILDGAPLHEHRKRASNSRRHLLRCRCVPVHRPLLVQNIRHGPTPSTESAHMKTVIRPLLSRTSGQ